MLKPFRLVIKQWSNSGSTANPGQPCASVATLCLRWNSGPSITSTASRGAKKHIKHHQNALKALKLQLPQNSLTFIWTTIHPNSNIPCASDAPNMLPAVAALAALAALAAALVAPIRKRFRIIQNHSDRCDFDIDLIGSIKDGRLTLWIASLPMAWYLSCCACWFLPEWSQQLTRFNLKPTIPEATLTRKNSTYSTHSKLVSWKRNHNIDANTCSNKTACVVGTWY